MKSWYDKEFKGLRCEPDSADEWLELIWQIAFDYDGYETVESLKKLIDEIVKMSQKARVCLVEGKIFEDLEESAKSWIAAKAERDKDLGESNYA